MVGLSLRQLFAHAAWVLVSAVAVATVPDSAHADTFRATVTSVQDGDSLTVRSGPRGAGRLLRIRLAGIDAPESKQPFGQAARDSLKAQVDKREVALACHKQDRYQRRVCRVQVVAPSGLASQGHPNADDVNREQLKRGMAWHDIRHQGELPQAVREADARAEAQARAARRGLFSQPGPTPPWEWRSRQRKLGVR